MESSIDDVQHQPATAEEEEVCWVCLEGSSSGGEPLLHPCLCPRPVHEACLARWQLHCAGRDEELHCRFCERALPPWRDTLARRSASAPSTPSASSSAAPAAAAAPAPQPVMSLQFGEHTFWINVATGPGGVERFKADVRRLLGLSPFDEFNITFECAMPLDGSKLELHGLQAYDAAVFCATLTAAERMNRAAADAAAAAAPHTTHSATAVADGAGAAAPTAAAPAPALPSSTHGSQQLPRHSATGADLEDFMSHTAGRRRRRSSGVSSSSGYSGSDAGSSSSGFSSASSSSSSGLNWLLAKLHDGWQWAR